MPTAEGLYAKSSSLLHKLIFAFMAYAYLFQCLAIVVCVYCTKHRWVTYVFDVGLHVKSWSPYDSIQGRIQGGGARRGARAPFWESKKKEKKGEKMERKGKGKKGEKGGKIYWKELLLTFLWKFVHLYLLLRYYLVSKNINNDNFPSARFSRITM